MASKAAIQFEIDPDRNYDDLRLGFLRGSNPYGYRRLMGIATLNGARTMQAPMRAAAPVGRTTKTPGRLRRAVKARRARYNNPAAVVGVFAGSSRSDLRGAWYRWFVTSGVRGRRTTKNGTFSVKPIPADPFVGRVSDNVAVKDRAMEAVAKTTEKFLNDGAFRKTILRFRKGR